MNGGSVEKSSASSDRENPDADPAGSSSQELHVLVLGALLWFLVGVGLAGVYLSTIILTHASISVSIGTILLVIPLAAVAVTFCILGLGRLVKKWLAPVACALGFLLGPCAIAYSYVFWPGPQAVNWYHSIPFDSDRWKGHPTENSSENDWPLRLRMVDDLMRRHDLIGKTEDEVADLLGPPHWREFNGEEAFVYILGPERTTLIRLDREYLVIAFRRRSVMSTNIIKR